MFSRGDRLQVLLGVAGLGKTFIIANVIKRVQKPKLVIAHNKTLEIIYQMTVEQTGASSPPRKTFELSIPHKLVRYHRIRSYHLLPRR